MLHDQVEKPGAELSLPSAFQKRSILKSCFAMLIDCIDRFVEHRGQTQQLTPQFAEGADRLITMGCRECPYIPGLTRDAWPFFRPRGRSIEEVRAVRDEI